MAIYGTAFLSLCLLCGLVAGNLIGLAIGVDANVGGVGIAMLLLIVVSDRLQRAGLMTSPSENGILFWSSIYIPIVVAMASIQNVRAAVSGSTVAIVAGAVVVIASFAMVPLVSRIGRAGEHIASLSETDSAGGEA